LQLSGIFEQNELKRCKSHGSTYFDGTCSTFRALITFLSRLYSRSAQLGWRAPLVVIGLLAVQILMHCSKEISDMLPSNKICHKIAIIFHLSTLNKSVLLTTTKNVINKHDSVAKRIKIFRAFTVANKISPLPEGKLLNA
jgi:hypothetical protein